MPLDKRNKNKTTICHYYTSSRKTMIYGIIITRDEGQSLNHSHASVEMSKKIIEKEASYSYICMKYINTHIYTRIIYNVMKFAVLM